MKKKCDNCNSCKTVYRVFRYKMWQTHWKYCKKKKSLIDDSRVCEFWKKRKTNRDLSQERFNKAEEDIKTIISLLKEDETP